MRIDPYNHKDKYYIWRKAIGDKIPDISRENSEIILLEKGKKFVTEYLYKVSDALQNGPELEKMNCLYHELISDPNKYSEYTRQAIAMYKSISPSMNRKSKEQKVQEILSFLRLKPGARPIEIDQAIQTKNSSGYLRQLLISKEIRREIQGKTSHYFLAK